MGCVVLYCVCCVDACVVRIRLLFVCCVRCLLCVEEYWIALHCIALYSMVLVCFVLSCFVFY